MPNPAQVTHLLGALVQQLILCGQVVQLGQRQAHGARAQSSTHAAHVLRLSHAAQPQAQVLGFVAGKHRVAVRQVDRGHAPHTQRVAHGSGLFACAHQHGDVFGLQRFIALVRINKPGQWVTKPSHDLLGAQGRQVRQRIALAAQCGVMHQGHGFHATVAGREDFDAALRAYRLERQRVFIAALVAKGIVRDLEPAVDHIDHRLGGSEIGAQHMVAASGGEACGQVAVDVGTAKTVDRLLGVPDQQQRCVLPVLGCAVDAVKNAELQRRGVLKLIDHRHRKLLAQSLRQALARLGVGQRHIEALQHVGKTEQPAAPLELGHALQHMRAGVQAGGLCGVGQGRQSGLQIGEGLRLRRQLNGITFFATLQQAMGCQTIPACTHCIFQCLRIPTALRPAFECIHPLLGAPHLQN